MEEYMDDDHNGSVAPSPVAPSSTKYNKTEYLPPLSNTTERLIDKQDKDDAFKNPSTKVHVLSEKEASCDSQFPPGLIDDIFSLLEDYPQKKEDVAAFSESLPSPDIFGFDHTTGSGKYVCQPVEEEPGPVNERSPDECLAAVQFRTEGLSNTKEKSEEPLIDEDFKDLGSQSLTQNQTKSAKNPVMSAKSSKRLNRSVKRQRESEGLSNTKEKTEEPLIDEDFKDLGSQSSTQNQTKSAKNLEMSAKSSKRQNLSSERKRRQHMSPNGRFRGKKTECPAIVKQCGEKYQEAGGDHTHEPTSKKRRKVELRGGDVLDASDGHFHFFRKQDDRSSLNEKTVIYDIIKKGTSRGRDVLDASDGYQYTKKRTSKKGICTWRCRVRNKETE